MNLRPVVVKVGGSLLNATDLVPRLQRWVSSSPQSALVCLTGGGKPVKALRGPDILNHDDLHWACISIMCSWTTLVSREYPGGCLVHNWDEAMAAWSRGELPFFHVESFLQADDARPDRLPHSWDVSSDSIAARLAARHGADLVLLKSCPVIGGPYDWATLAKESVVDAWFPLVAPTVANITLANLPE